MKKTSPNILVFASGTKTGGGSGFETMVRAARTEPPILDAWICAVITNHFAGGVWHKAKALGIPSEYWVGPYRAQGYQNFVKYFNADYVMLSGWLKLVAGLDPARTINIHPGPLPRFGGPKLYGHYVHEAVMAAYQRGEITHSAVTRAALANAEVRAPFAGTLTNLDLKVGEFAASGTPVLTIADLSGWVVKTTDLTEIDVVNLKEGQPVDITLDAFPDVTMKGNILSISENYTERPGDIVYKVTILLTDKNPAIRWGMTAKLKFIK